MIHTLPLEILEKILGYLSGEDLKVLCLASNLPLENLSEYFWKTFCMREDFLKISSCQEWHECFQHGVDKRMGYYSKTGEVPRGTLKHVFFKFIVMFEEYAHHVYLLENNKFNLTQTINKTESEVEFKDEYMIVREALSTALHGYNFISNSYELCITIPEIMSDIFGISNQYCTAFNTNSKCFHLYKLSNGSKKVEHIPSDVKFLILKILHNNMIVISVISLNQGYKIKVFDITCGSWILDLACFDSTGITNDPNVWVGSNFIGCCDISYRLRGNYFGPFKVWNKQGTMVLKADITPSTKHYLRCFFKEKNIIITTSDTTISVYGELGENISTTEFPGEFKDIKISSGRLLFIMLECSPSLVTVFDWRLCRQMYSIQLSGPPMQWMASEYFHYFINQSNGNQELVQFF